MRIVCRISSRETDEQEPPCDVAAVCIYAIIEAWLGWLDKEPSPQGDA